ADIQRALEESLKSVYDAPRGPLSPVVIREPESRKYQPLPKVQGKGKEKVTDEQMALDLLTSQTPKKKSHADQFIYQRHTSTPTESSSHDESSSLYAELGLIDSEVESDKDAGPNPGDAAASQPQSSPVVHAGPNLEHMDLEATYVSTQPHPEQMDEGFIATAYISFGDLFFNDKQSEADNEKTTAETKAESMVSVTIQQDTSAIPPMTTPIIDLTSRPDSPNVHQPLQETAAKTTTTITIHPLAPQPQQSTIDSMLMKRISELEHIMANLIQNNKHLEERLDSHGARLYTLENLDIPQKVSKAVDEIVIDAVDWAIQAPLWNRFRDLLEADMKEINKTHEDHMMLYEALEKSINRDQTEKLLKDLAEALKKKKKRRDSPKCHLGLHLISHILLHHQQVHLELHDLLELLNHHKYHHHLHPLTKKWKPLDEDRPATPEPAWSIPSSDVPVPKNNWASALASTYSPPPEDSLFAQTGDMAMFMDWFCKRQGITELKPQDLEGPAFELVKVFHPNVIHLQYQMEECHKLLTDSMGDSIIRNNVSKPLPLGGPPGQVTI
nr:hypothetical protein [Tanacetum cinerariifolium]